MLFQNQKLVQHIKSAVFAMVFMLIVLIILAIERERFSFLMFFPICSLVALGALYEIIGCRYARKREMRYLAVEEQELVYYNYFGKVKYRIPKQDIVRILREEDFLKVYVKTKRNLSFADRLRTICVENQWNMYSLMLYSEISETEIYNHNITDSKREKQMQEYIGMSRYLFSFVIGCVTWYIISGIFVEQSTYLILLLIMSLALYLDYKLNPVNICEANWIQATIKCITMGLFFAVYTAFASFNSREIVFEERGIQLLSQEKVIVCLVIVLIAWGLLIFRQNLVTIIQSRRKCRSSIE